MYNLERTPYKLRDWIDINKIDWKKLSFNSNTIYLLEQSLDKINRYFLSSKPKAIHLLKQNLDKINWDKLSENKNALTLLEQNPDKINWMDFSSNLSIFEIDYQVLKQQIGPFKGELTKKYFHPDRLVRYLETYHYDIGEDEYE